MILAKHDRPDAAPGLQTVFVVDDDEAVRDALEMLLRSVGIRSESYADAGEFLAAFDSRRSGCLVLDIRMPGISGLDLQSRLAQRGAPLPIIFITGHGAGKRSSSGPRSTGGSPGCRRGRSRCWTWSSLATPTR